LEMDLRGQPKRDYDVRIRGGVGEATVRLPRDAGIQANATGGLGSINVRGLTKKEGDRYENDAYEHAKFRIHVDVKGGIGNINLYAE
jgi:predicted membrane protein